MNIFHILNRGIEKKKVFYDKTDYSRFIAGLYKFNNKNSALRFENKNFIDIPKQNKIVEILQWNIMPNHYHLLVQEKVDGGAVEFVKRIGNGYTKYFNIRNNRSGYLFQNAAKIIPVVHNKHFLYLPFYIESNPIKLIEPNWKENGIKNSKKAAEFLESYFWSSYLDHISIHNFTEIINQNLFFQIFDTNPEQYKADFLEWLSNVNLPR
ncbi:MAG: hypothetical protein A2817_02945 [Candidatus Yanofskybacteria bacterium RIFCSPHIGHO2_01_FULL_39_8b]|uniref:Transposase IS200-like domain-containing protein n=1 Tax=Candidatus Yanofskybacteria bacterium RIFCSPHIGHO2_01_FULL_39_8b TaxID=1802659 RepID=A0A1F8E9Z5_9BACT|nr:MAG: hypothetical protein A2817_02945 [Candidatus Yanofskybacteria bacterium RIFCSPHIGHO2_01_FULL_39_8b]